MTVHGKETEAKKNIQRVKTQSVPPAFKPLWQQFEKVFKNAMRDCYCSKDTLFKNRSRMRQFVVFCAREFKMGNLKNIGDKHISAFVEYRRQMNITEKSIKNDLSAIRMFHQYIPNTRHRLSGNEKFKLGTTPDGRIDRAWGDHEYQAMLDHAKKLGRTDVELTMRLARDSGLRIHECLRISKKQAKKFLESDTITIKGKGGRIRDVPLRDEARAALKEALENVEKDKDKLFVSRGKRTDLVKDSIENFIRDHRVKCQSSDQRDVGINITFHGLRHTYAREEFLKRVADGNKKKAQKEVALLLGHGRPRVVKIYLGSAGKDG